MLGPESISARNRPNLLLPEYAVQLQKLPCPPRTRLDEMTYECWLDGSNEECRLGEISLQYDTEVIGFLVPVRGFSSEAARELAILVEEAGNIVTLIDQELAAL